MTKTFYNDSVNILYRFMNDSADVAEKNHISVSEMRQFLICVMDNAIISLYAKDTNTEPFKDELLMYAEPMSRDIERIGKMPLTCEVS